MEENLPQWWDDTDKFEEFHEDYKHVVEQARLLKTWKKEREQERERGREREGERERERQRDVVSVWMMLSLVLV